MPTFRLWVANTTKQDRIFTYRLRAGVPGTRYEHLKEVNKSQPSAWSIKRGAQICIEDNFTKAEIDDIVEQNGKYGLKPAPEALSRATVFVGLMFSTEKPIPVEAIMSILENNDNVLERDAQKRRELTAAAISDNIANDLHDRTGRNREDLRPARVEVEQREETPGTPHVASGVEVVSNPEQTRPRHGRARA